jgi:hypothetical protein
MTIPFGQHGHFSQTGPSKKSRFLVVFIVVSFTTNIVPKVDYKYVGP